jgi:two-component system, sensor histidine kinase and response regulator
MIQLASHYDAALVVLSVGIAILAAGAALDLASRVTAAHGWFRGLWLLSGAFAMGLGIWSMHYTGMLAFKLPLPILYHLETVALSLFAAIAASGIALFVASRNQLGWPRIVLGSFTMGAGIAGMHYIGMAAMRMPATIVWRPSVVVLSIAIAVVVAGVALWFAFTYGRPTASAWSWRKLGTAVLMGAAIPAMHYTGMAAAQFHSGPPPSLASAIGITTLGAYAIGAGTMIVLVMAIGTSLVSRYGEERLRASEANYRTLATELQKALAEVRTLQGILPICASCKRIHADGERWEPLESYVRIHTDAEFSHGLCPDCAARDWGGAPPTS